MTKRALSEQVVSINSILEALAMRIKTRQMVLALSIAESHSLRQAAERLHMTQPGATRMLQDLERVLKVSIFERTTRGMKPTPAGEVVLKHLRRATSDLNAIQDDLAVLQSGISGRVRIGVIGSMATLLLPRSISSFKARAPNVTVEITEGTHDVLLAGLRSGELDVAVIRTSTDLQASDLRFELLFTELFLVVTDSRQRFRAKGIDLAQLVDRPWILPPHGVPVRQQLDAAFMASAGRVPRDVIESASILVNQQLLDEGGRFALMPENVAHHYEKLGLVTIVKVRLPEISGQLTLTGLADRVHMPVVSDFLEYMRNVARMLEKVSYSHKIRN